MKWVLAGSLCLFCSVTQVRGQAAAELYNTGVTDLQNNRYDDAAAAFDKIISDYPTFQNIDDTHLNAGQAYLYASKYKEAIDRLQKEAAPDAHPEFRGTGLYLTALAQFYLAQQSEKPNPSDTDKAASEKLFETDIATLTTLVNFIGKIATPENTANLESALYYRSLANYEIDKFPEAETDLITLTTDPRFAKSLSLPEYFLRLGSCYAVQTNDAVTAKQTPEQIDAVADKAVAAFDAVANDPNALVQANEANMSKAQLYFLLAQIDNAPAAYEKALDAFRKVRRKADLIPAQQARLDQLRKMQADATAAAAAAHNGAGTYNNQLELIIQREQGRLDALVKGPDPIIDALIRMAECYTAMKQPDEARTILHRLLAHAQLTADQQKEVDFQNLYSYVLGGQTAAADKALDAYLAKHAGDPQADSISMQIASKLLERKDDAGALAQATRSLHDFPNGRYVAKAIEIEASALTGLGRIKDSAQVVDDFLKAHPTSPEANAMLLRRATNEAASGDLAGAAADYKRIQDSAVAGAELQMAAAAGYIQILQRQNKFDDVLAAAKDYEAKYPQSKQLAVVKLFAAQALDAKKDPGAVAALQAVARQFPQDPIVAPFALYLVVDIYRRAGNLPLMMQATKDLQTACPDAYAQIMLADDEVSGALKAQNKFADAAAIYEPLTHASDAEVAADAEDKIGDVWFADARNIHYQSLPPPPKTDRADAEKILGDAEHAYLTTLQTAPTHLFAVGNAFDGLINVARQRRSWGLLKEEPDVEAYLGQLGSGFTTPDMQARFEMAKARLVFMSPNGAAQFAAVLDRYKKVMAANPDLALTRQEADTYGQLLIAAKDYDGASKIYSDLLARSPANESAALGAAYYGLGAVAMAQGNLPQAKAYFLKLEALPGGGRWSPHIIDADYGIALADEQSGDPADVATAQRFYGQIMKQTQAGAVLQAKALLGYARLLEKSGNGVKPAAAGPTETAVHYYQQVDLFYGAATPEQSAEGLFDAGQAYDKAGEKDDAKKAYDLLRQNYQTSAPDWVSKIPAGA